LPGDEDYGMTPLCHGLQKCGRMETWRRKCTFMWMIVVSLHQLKILLG
jgi:hypothetical protein